VNLTCLGYFSFPSFKTTPLAKLDELARPNTFTIGSVIYKGKIADYGKKRHLKIFSSDFSLIVDFHLVQLLLIFFQVISLLLPPSF
jgi:hypothetical protein